MPSETTLLHTHRYGSYLLDLRHHWAYATGSGRAPGRNRSEKNLTYNKHAQTQEYAVKGQG